MIKIKDLIGEAKQIGNLYHFTTVDGFVGITETNIIRGSKVDNEKAYLLRHTKYDDLQGGMDKGKLNNYYKDLAKKYSSLSYVSFTRDKNFNRMLRSNAGVKIRITFDGNKLSNKYPIDPYQYNANYGRISTGIGDEQEERLFIKSGKEITNANNYIIESELVDNTSLLNVRRTKVLIDYLYNNGLSDFEILLFEKLKVNDTTYSEEIYSVYEKNKTEIKNKMNLIINF